MLDKMPKYSQKEVNARMREATSLASRTLVADRRHFAHPKMAWRSLFTKHMLQYIVECTNDHILTVGGLSDVTSVRELEAVIGILYMHGVSRSFYHHRSDLWADGINVRAVVNAVPHERFLYLLQNLRFEKDELVSDDQCDALKPIRTFVESFVANCQNNYDVGPYVVVDEKVEVIFGPCPFRVQLVPKPQRCGIKLLTLVDPITFYVNNLTVVTDPNASSRAEWTMKLVRHLTGSGKTLIMDPWFSSLDLVQTLVKEYRIFCIAALKPSDSLIPPFFASHHRNERTYMTAFVDSDVALTSFVSSERKVLNTLASHPKYYRRSGVDEKSPIAYYKRFQPSGEVVDVLTSYYTTAQHTNSWALSLFFALLDIGSVNAQVLWLSSRGETIVQRNVFLRTLALGLMEELQSESSNHDNSALMGSPPKRPRMSSILLSGQKSTNRCRLCPRRLNRKTSTKCYECGLPICRKHTTFFCVTCAPPKE